MHDGNGEEERYASYDDCFDVSAEPVEAEQYGCSAEKVDDGCRAACADGVIDFLSGVVFHKVEENPEGDVCGEDGDEYVFLAISPHECYDEGNEDIE